MGGEEHERVLLPHSNNRTNILVCQAVGENGGKALARRVDLTYSYGSGDFSGIPINS